MYGSIFRMKPKAGQSQAVVDQIENWGRSIKPNISGHVESYSLVSTTNPGEVLGVAIFESESAYRNNSEASGQDQWYRQLRELLTEDPEWNDGNFVQMGKQAE